ncbi:hypothetical protein BJX70DRAFT_362519 [Aspergillus crustosus]
MTTPLALKSIYLLISIQTASSFNPVIDWPRLTESKKCPSPCPVRGASKSQVCLRLVARTNPGRSRALFQSGQEHYSLPLP